MYKKEELQERRKNLSAKQKALLKKRLSSQATSHTIQPRSQSGPVPLSFAQQRMWFLNQLEPNSPAYNEPTAVRLTGGLDVEAVERSFGEIMRRHEVLRTELVVIDEQPMQRVNSTVGWHLARVDLSHLSAAEQEVQIAQLATAAALRPFDLSQDLPWQAALIRLGHNEHVLLITWHHIVTDGWSMNIFIHEFEALYQAYSRGQPSPLPELDIQYADFALWQRKLLTGELLERQLAYWKEQLTNAPTQINLPADHPRPAVQSYRGGRYTFHLPQELMPRLNGLQQQTGTTLFMILQAAFALLLSRYSDAADILIGTPVANRQQREIEPLIGYFVNTLVLRNDLSGNPTFAQFLQRVRLMALEAYQHQDVPFDLVVEALQPERSLSYSPLFQVEFILEHMNVQRGKKELVGLTITPIELELPTTRFDLTLRMKETEDGLSGCWEYSSDLFEPATIGRMAAHFQTLLEGVVAHPEQSLAALPLLTEAERHQLLSEWNNTQADYPLDHCIHQRFEEQVERTPDANAVTYQQQKLTYRELNSKANQLAHYLIKQGVGPDLLVGICMERSLEMVIALLGTLKAGGAYVPLDPTLPSELLQFMCQDADVQLLLTQSKFVDMLLHQRVQSLCLDGQWDLLQEECDSNPQTSVQPEHLAYCIYTSGSTGRPKGVMIPHRAICNHMSWKLSTFAFQASDKIVQKTPFSFDASVWEFFAPLLVGGQLVMAEPGGHQDSRYMIELLQREQITILQLVPTLLQMLLDAGGLEKAHTLKQLFCGGETLPLEQVRHFKSLHDAQMINLYGPTEACIDVTFYRIQDGISKVLIGRPISNMQAYILDPHLQPVPIGVPGELHVAGPSLARGYLNRPQLTEEKFIPNPFPTERLRPGSDRLYKTGDLCRYLTDGNIEHLGRMDHQVKIRGFRIELGEIETLLSQHESVQQALVLVQQEATGKRIVAYVVAEFDHSNTLRAYLAERLPDYMIPSAFVQLESMPLTPNGKIDRRALPAPSASSRFLEEEPVLPRTPMEKSLTTIWQEVLKVEQIGIHDNFFEMGGYSLLVMQLMSKLSTEMNLHISPKLLFLHPTIAQLAEVLNSELSQVISSHIPPADTIHQASKQVEPPRVKESTLTNSFLQIEPRPLLSLFATRKIDPVDAVALGYLSVSGLNQLGLSRHDEVIDRFFAGLPQWTEILETKWGRIAGLYLPRLDIDLFSDQDELVRLTIEALEMAGQIGADVVSLTGLLAPATDEGHAVANAIANQTHFPRITTGHTTSSATFVLAIKKILQESGRHLTGERVAVIGLGPVGMSTLRLMLRHLPHPQEIILCDLYSRRAFLEETRQKLIQELGFQGNVQTSLLQVTLPAEVYQATLIVGATNVPDILDVAKLQPGTMIVDHADRHCFGLESAIQRFQQHGDILFTERSVLQSPYPIKKLIYLPPDLEKMLSPTQRETFLNYAPFRITGCVFSGLLSSKFEELYPTIGIPDTNSCLKHLEVLEQLEFQVADLHYEKYLLPQALIRKFRERFAHHK
jgi:amino acid adenylation domain-containing protein